MTNDMTFRVLDAAANRAREGLRVVEDYVRFVLDDRFLTEQLKNLRHDLTATLAKLPHGNGLAMRDTTADVGTTISTAAEVLRVDATEVATASWKRLQEALRSLEEFAKIINPEVGSLCEALRYRAYTLEKATSTVHKAKTKLAVCRLYVLIDACENESAFKTFVKELLSAGVDVVQLRDKRVDDRTLLTRGRMLRTLIRESAVKTLFVMNDRPDLAVLCDADGVHVGQEELPVHEVRRIVGSELLIGVSTHSIEQARAAVLAGADYLGVGPTFPSTTKNFTEFPGLAFVREVAAEIALPAFAIGGITPENVKHVRSAGLRRIAVSGVVTATNNRKGMLAKFREVLAVD